MLARFCTKINTALVTRLDYRFVVLTRQLNTHLDARLQMYIYIYIFLLDERSENVQVLFFLSTKMCKKSFRASPKLDVKFKLQRHLLA